MMDCELGCNVPSWSFAVMVQLSLGVTLCVVLWWLFYRRRYKTFVIINASNSNQRKHRTHLPFGRNNFSQTENLDD